MPAGCITSCKCPIRTVGAEYMLAQVIPQRDKRRNRYAEVLQTLQDFCGAEPSTLQEHQAWRAAFERNLNAPKPVSKEGAAFSYYATGVWHRMSVLGHRERTSHGYNNMSPGRISLNSMLGSRKRRHILMHSARCRSRPGIKAVRHRPGEMSAFRRHGNAVLWPVFKNYLDLRDTFILN